MDTKDIEKRNKLMKIMKVKMEIDFRCGDGTGQKPTSHSVNCHCDELNKILDSLEDSTKETKV